MVWEGCLAGGGESGHGFGGCDRAAAGFRGFGKMIDTLLGIYIAAGLSGFAAIFAFLAFLRAGKPLPMEQFTAALRAETGFLRQGGQEEARATRQELTDNARGFQETVLKAFQGLGESLSSQAHKLEGGIDAKLSDAALRQAAGSRDLREEMRDSFQKLGQDIAATLKELALHQTEKLDHATAAIQLLASGNERTLSALKQAVEDKLETIRAENASKLERIRETVDEKLQSTLEARLGESFNRVAEHLERVHKGIGEMQAMAAGVGDLKNVLSGVRVRGAFGELQLEALLEQFLSPEQYIKNAHVKENTLERVEFAIKLPGRDASGEVLLPVDAKFPLEDYERLIAASEKGDAAGVQAAGQDLERTVRVCARTIRDKYIAPPRTAEFAIMFLPTESLYAEVLRRPGLFEQLQREFHVTLAGPATFSALLNALQMGFRSLALEQRSGEVWKVLGAVRNEFSKYNEVVDRLAKQLNTAAESVSKLGTRTRSMNKTLRHVEMMPDSAAQILIGAEVGGIGEPEEQEDAPEA
jgi:DNA recombination protein RmuC